MFKESCSITANMARGIEPHTAQVHRLPVGKIVEFEPYYEHENTSQGKPARINAVGLILSLFFRD